MTPGARRGAALALASTFAPTPVAAEFRLAPSLSVFQVYDDNVFAMPGAPRQADEIWRVSPRLALLQHSARFTLRGRYGLDGELFRRHPELNTATALQDAIMDLSWHASNRVVLGASASYTTAASTGALNSVTGWEMGRMRARRWQTSQSISRRLGPLSKATLEHGLLHEEMDGLAEDEASATASDLQTLTLKFEREAGAFGQWRFAYDARRFTFGEDAVVTHVATVGLTRQLGAFTTVLLDAGPRLSDRVVSPDVTAGVRRRFRRGDLGLAYVHNQTTVIGEPGPVTAHGLSGTYGRRLGRSFRLGGGASAFKVRGADNEATVYRWATEITWGLTPRLAVIAAHNFSFQRGVIGRALPSTTEMTRNTVTLGIAPGSLAR